MQRSLLRTALLGVACGLIGASGTVLAQSSSVEAVAMLGGRIIGAAKACGINAERIRRTSERMMSVVGNNAASASEMEIAKGYFIAAQGTGAEEVRAEKSKCTGIHVDFSEIEVKLGRAPVADKDPLAAKRGVPALGALKPDTAATRKQ